MSAHQKRQFETTAKELEDKVRLLEDREVELKKREIFLKNKEKLIEDKLLSLNSKENELKVLEISLHNELIKTNIVKPIEPSFPKAIKSFEVFSDSSNQVKETSNLKTHQEFIKQQHKNFINSVAGTKRPPPPPPPPPIKAQSSIFGTFANNAEISTFESCSNVNPEKKIVRQPLKINIPNILERDSLLKNSDENKENILNPDQVPFMKLKKLKSNV